MVATIVLLVVIGTFIYFMFRASSNNRILKLGEPLANGSNKASSRSAKLRLNAAARRECEAVNESGRARARQSDDWNDREWLHPNDWVRMRSPILLLVAVARADAEVHSDEADIIASWTAWRLENSHWGGAYSESKIQALRKLIPKLNPSRSEIEDAIADCANSMSKKQKRVYFEHLNRIKLLSGDAGIKLAHTIEAEIASVDGAFDEG